MSFSSIEIETQARGYRACVPYSNSQEACENAPGYPACRYIETNEEFKQVAYSLDAAGAQGQCESTGFTALDSQGKCNYMSHVCVPDDYEYLSRGMSYYQTSELYQIDTVEVDLPFLGGSFERIDTTYYDTTYVVDDAWRSWDHTHDGIRCEHPIRHHEAHVEESHSGFDCSGDCTYDGLQVSNCEWSSGECIQNVIGIGDDYHRIPCHYGEYLISPTFNYEFLCPISNKNKRGEFDFIAGAGLKPADYGPQYRVRGTRKFNARKCRGHFDGQVMERDKRDSGRGDREAFEQNLIEGIFSPPSHYAENMYHTPAFRDECTREACDHD